MKSQAIIRVVLAGAILPPVGFVTIGSAEDLDRDRDQLKTQQQLKDKDKLQNKDQLKEQERTRERERAREHMQTERPEKPQHERSERGGGGRH